MLAKDGLDRLWASRLYANAMLARLPWITELFTPPRPNLTWPSKGILEFIWPKQAATCPIQGHIRFASIRNCGIQRTSKLEEPKENDQKKTIACGKSWGRIFSPELFVSYFYFNLLGFLSSVRFRQSFWMQNAARSRYRSCFTGYESNLNPIWI